MLSVDRHGRSRPEARARRRPRNLGYAERSLRRKRRRQHSSSTATSRTSTMKDAITGSTLTTPQVRPVPPRLSAEPWRPFLWPTRLTMEASSFRTLFSFLLLSSVCCCAVVDLNWWPRVGRACADKKCLADLPSSIAAATLAYAALRPYDPPGIMEISRMLDRHSRPND